MPSTMLYQFTTVVNTEIQVLPPSVGRKRITVSFSNNSAGYLRPDSNPGVLGGLAIAIGSGPLVLDEEDYGDWVKGPWFFISGFVGVVGVAETLK